MAGRNSIFTPYGPNAQNIGKGLDSAIRGWSDSIGDQMNLEQNQEQFDAKLAFDKERAAARDDQWNKAHGLAKDKFAQQKKKDGLLAKDRADQKNKDKLYWQLSGEDFGFKLDDHSTEIQNSVRPIINGLEKEQEMFNSFTTQGGGDLDSLVKLHYENALRTGLNPTEATNDTAIFRNKIAKTLNSTMGMADDVRAKQFAAISNSTYKPKIDSIYRAIHNGDAMTKEQQIAAITRRYANKYNSLGYKAFNDFVRNVVSGQSAEDIQAQENTKYQNSLNLFKANSKTKSGGGYKKSSGKTLTDSQAVEKIDKLSSDIGSSDVNDAKDIYNYLMSNVPDMTPDIAYSTIVNSIDRGIIDDSLPSVGADDFLPVLKMAQQRVENNRYKGRSTQPRANLYQPRSVNQVLMDKLKFQNKTTTPEDIENFRRSLAKPVETTEQRMVVNNVPNAYKQYISNFDKADRSKLDLNIDDPKNMTAKEENSLELLKTMRELDNVANNTKPVFVMGGGRGMYNNPLLQKQAHQSKLEALQNRIRQLQQDLNIQN